MVVETPILLEMVQTLLLRTPGGSYREFGELLHHHVPFDRLTLCAAESSGADLRVIQALAGPCSTGETVGRLLPLCGSLAGEVFRDARWLHLPDLDLALRDRQRWPAEPEDALRALRAGMHACLAFPLAPAPAPAATAAPVGVCLLWARQPHLFGDAHQALLRQLAPALSAALHNDLVYLAAERRSLELGALERLARATRASLELEQVIPACLDAALSILGVSAGGLLLMRGDALDLVLSRNLEDPRPLQVPTGDGSPLGRAFRERRAVLAPSIQDDPLLRGLLMTRGGARRVWLLAIPLFAGESPKGVVFACGLDTFATSPAELERLATIGHWIGSAIADAERHAAARALASANVFYRELLAHLHDAVIATDESGRIEEWTGGAEALTEWTREEVLGQDVNVLLYGPRAPEMRRTIEDALRTQPVYRGESQILRKDGRPALWESIIARIEMPGGRPDGFVGVHRDVGEARRQREERRKQQHLASLGSLAGGLAHDFNNTLGAVLLTALDLRDAARRGDTLPGSQLTADMDVIIEAARRGASLAGQLLAFSRGAPLSLEPLPIDEVVRQALRPFHKGALRIETSLAPGLPPVQGDREQIGRALSNLLRNAAEAMPEGGRLLVETRMVERPGLADQEGEGLPAGRYVRIAVQDEGPGLDPSVEARLFEPFVTTKQGAAGLGLAVAFGVVRAHGGTISMEPGAAARRGTTFAVYLPLLGDVPLEVVAPPAPAPAVAARILVVDDEPVLTRIAARILGKEGYLVDAVNSGVDALARYAGPGAYDLVVLDSTMPGMSGREVLEELLRRDPGVRVLVMSGYSVDGAPARLLTIGARGFLPKPFTPQELLQALRAAMED